MEPLLSVVIPVYNVEKYLKRCIDSILVQTWKNYEIILINDGSTDNSSNICDDYAEKYQHISVIHKKNGGLSDARNVGISHARGIFVYFPDSDDWISEDTFSDLAEVLNEGIFDIISFNREFVKSEDDKLMSPELKKQELSGNVALLEMLNQGDVTGFANDKIYKKSLFLENKIEFPVGKYYEDLGTNYKLFLAANRVYVTNKKYYYYFVDNPDSITQSWSGKKLEDIFGFSKEIFYSQAVQSVFNSSELKILNCFYTDNLIYVLTILYKTNLSEECKQLTMDVNSELRKNGVSLLRFKKRTNFKKYVLYKLGLLKLVFDLRLRMKRYR